MLSVSGLSKSYGGVRPRAVLRNISFEVSAASFVAITGESGSGKSTLLNLIAGLEVPDSGSVRIDGVDLHGLDDDARTLLRRERLGFVFQAFHLLPHLTVEENVRLPLDLAGSERASAALRVRECLDSVGLGAALHDYPATLSGGEAQRVAIARALVHAPRLILADEPTGNLDPDNAHDVLALLRRETQGRGAACVLVTHSEAAAAYADRVLVLGREGLIERRVR